MPFDSMSLDDGREFRIEWPSNISATEAEDILAWVDLFVRKLPRFVRPTVDSLAAQHVPLVPQ